MNARLLLLLALTSLALGLAACSDDDDESGGATQPTVAETTDTTAADEPEEISTNLEAKPEIGKPSGDPPTKLVKEDIVVGKGRKAKEGDQVTVHYVGVNFSTGDQFDASWDRGEPTSFTLAKGQLIDGWVQGMKGMRVGGRRKLVIPPELGYGEAGSPPAIPPNETLVFVIDLKKIG
jgi:peptidylprolyl isomerase